MEKRRERWRKHNEEGMRRFENPTFLFRRLVVAGVREGEPCAKKAALKAMAKEYCEELSGPGLYVPTTFGALMGLGRHTAIFIATEGYAVGVESTDSLRALYVLHGVGNYSSDTVASLKKTADIDFEGVVELDIADADHQRRRLPDSRRHEVELVNRFAGDQSEFFSRVEQIGLYAPTPFYDPEICHSDLVYETPNRFGVSTRRRLGTEPCDIVELANSVVIGDGVLIWPSKERHSDRYGYVELIEQPTEGSPKVPLSLEDIAGQHGKLIAEVLDTRETPHIGDCFRWIFPETPDVGELIEFGIGTIVQGDDDAVGCKPDDDRKIDWLNPKALYRCHLQTVRLHFVPCERG